MTLSKRLKPLFLVITNWKELLTLCYERSGHEHYTTTHLYSPFSLSLIFSLVLHYIYIYIYLGIFPYFIA